MNIILIGTGYVGLVTGACLASRSNRVVCVDHDEQKLARLEQGAIPIYEPGLGEIVAEARQADRLHFSRDFASALTLLSAAGENERLLIFIAVGTPQGEDGSADLHYVIDVAQEIGKHLDQGAIIVNKSTVPIGTAKLVRGEIAWRLYHRQRFLDFEVVSNPEFLKEGSAIQDFFNPDRIIIGVETDEARRQMEALYLPFVSDPSKLLFVGIKEAELIKYASNAMLATRISFMNEIAKVCDRYEIDIDQVRHGVGADTRIGPAFLRAGCGYGGSCFPKDVQALIRIAQSVGIEPHVLNGVEQRNQEQKCYLYEMLVKRFGKNLRGLQIAVWGLAFKPDTDDMREAPSIELVRRLAQSGVRIRAHDPVARATAAEEFFDFIEMGAMEIVDDPLQALEGADALTVVTEWECYTDVAPQEIKSRLRQPIVFDGRNCLPAHGFRALGFEYSGIGRALGTMP